MKTFKSFIDADSASDVDNSFNPFSQLGQANRNNSPLPSEMHATQNPLKSELYDSLKRGFMQHEMNNKPVVAIPTLSRKLQPKLGKDINSNSH